MFAFLSSFSFYSFWQGSWLFPKNDFNAFPINVCIIVPYRFAIYTPVFDKYLCQMIPDENFDGQFLKIALTHGVFFMENKIDAPAKLMLRIPNDSVILEIYVVTVKWRAI